jgi:hypothetical protein
MGVGMLVVQFSWDSWEVHWTGLSDHDTARMLGGVLCIHVVTIRSSVM